MIIESKLNIPFICNEAVVVGKKRKSYIIKTMTGEKTYFIYRSSTPICIEVYIHEKKITSNHTLRLRERNYFYKEVLKYKFKV